MKKYMILLVGILIISFMWQVPECYPFREVTYKSPSPEEITVIQEEYSAPSASGSVATSGESMNPTFPANQKCVCRATNDYQIGDVITFFANYDSETKIIMHRIHALVEHEGVYSYITKGDNNEYPDPLAIKEEAIVCEIDENVPVGAWLLNWGGWLW